MAPYMRDTQRASMSATIAMAATMDAAARSMPVLSPTNGTARNIMPAIAVSTPLMVLTKLERSIIRATA